MTVGQRIRISRRACGLSLRDLEIRIDNRVTAQAISKYERDESMPSSGVLIALADALSATGLAAIEVHVSNVHARERFRRHSYIAPVAWGQITGFGFRGYRAALHLLHQRWTEMQEEGEAESTA